ncbi:MAG: TonB-dependent receptor, partial [Desulfuromonadales bacterium]
MLLPVSKRIFGCLLFIGLTAPFCAVAEEPVAILPTEMETVTVIGQPEDLLSGASILAGETLRQLPLKNGSIAEAITVLPHVQAGEAQRTSERGGEILPPLISISGARPYENYYSVDGVGLNSLLDPLADSPTAISNVPGHPQRTFIQRDLIDSVTVYDSNVPARYGHFLGGVVDAKTRMPAKRFGGSISDRMTQDEWASQHIDESKEDEFSNATDHNYQPDYLKHDGSLTLDIPLDENSGLLAAYTTLRSEVKLTHLGQARDQDKILDNYFLKYAWNPVSPWSLELSGTYTPSEETFFLKNYRDSDFTIDRGGYSLNGILTRKLAAGNVSLAMAYLATENSRTAPNESKRWQFAPSTNWGQSFSTYSFEGGYGDLETEEESLQFKADVSLDPVQAGAVSHAISYGFAYTRDGGSYDRTESAYIYNSSKLSKTVICADGDSACIAGEQFLDARNVYAAESASAVIHRQAYYVEDLLTFWRFSLRPGLRFEHNDYLDNTNLAHRLAGGFDLFGNGTTLFSAGHNRYYGEALLTYKLREAITP